MQANTELSAIYGNGLYVLNLLIWLLQKQCFKSLCDCSWAAVYDYDRLLWLEQLQRRLQILRKVLVYPNCDCLDVAEIVFEARFKAQFNALANLVLAVYYVNYFRPLVVLKSLLM